MRDLHLNIDGPHSDDYTREVARGLAECARVLNHATYPGPGVTYPSTVYAVLGAVRAAVAGFDQLARQLDAHLTAMRDTGNLRDNHGMDPGTTVAHARQALAESRTAASALEYRLSRAHNATSSLGLHLRPTVRGGPKLDDATEDDYSDSQADYTPEEL